MSQIPYIEFKNVTFSYGHKEVLRGVSFTVPEQSFVCILGGSGSGKTTLLKLVSGQIFPQQGEVLIKGKTTFNFSTQELYQHRKNMGYLFQQGALFTDLNVADNIAFPLREHTAFIEQEIQSIVQRILTLVDLIGIGKLYPSELSGGMIKRVALARAIILEPNLLLYDEPFAGLDPITLIKIANLIKKTNQKINATSVMATHNIRESLSLVDKAILLADRQVVFEGSPEQILQNKHPLVEEFLEAVCSMPSFLEQDHHV